jgi:murein DD-endopeptidase MepM/ murein hydrolase activator NlpD
VFASHLATSADQAPERDLACVDLWTRSIERSRRRREVAALHRKHAPRRKAGSLALSAALLASPLVPMASAQTSGSGGTTTTEENEPSDAERVLAGDAILRAGDTGSAVVAVQQKLAVDDDGVFGPVTEDGVEGFQDRTGLPVTGEVDSRTWTELFRVAVSFVPEGSPEAKAIQASFSAGGASDGPEVEARVATSSAPTDDGEERSDTASDDGDAEPAPQRETVSSGEDGEADDSEADDSEADKSEEPKAQEDPPAPRPEAGVELSSDVPDPSIEADDEIAVTGDGNCATGVMGTPVEGTVTSTFGVDRGTHRHGGLDIGAPSGTAVRAALCGTVTQAGAQGAYGNLICVRHTSEFSTCYAHLSSFNTSAGEYVAVGELIGRVGSTGRSTGPHLHFETRINGRAHDPEPYLDGERRVPGTSTGGGEARAASNDGGGSPEAQRPGTSSSSSTKSGSGEIRTASTQEPQASGTGGGTPPGGVAASEDTAHDPRGYEYQLGQQSAPTQQPAAAAQSAPQQAPAQAAPAPAPVPAPQQAPALAPVPAPQQAPAEEQAPAQEPAPAEEAPAEIAVTQAVGVAPQAEVTTEAPAAEEPVAPVAETVAPVVEETPAAPVVEEPAAPVAEVAAPAAAAAAAAAPTPAG